MGESLHHTTYILMSCASTAAPPCKCDYDWHGCQFKFTIDVDISRGTFSYSSGFQDDGDCVGDINRAPDSRIRFIFSDGGNATLDANNYNEDGAIIPDSLHPGLRRNCTFTLNSGIVCKRAVLVSWHINIETGCACKRRPDEYSTTLITGRQGEDPWIKKQMRPPFQY